MAPSLRKISVPIALAQWRLVHRYLLNRDEDETDDDETLLSESNTTRDESSQWEDVDTESDLADQSLEEAAQHPASVRPQAKETPWLQKIHVATIPTFELFVFAFETRVLALESNGGSGQWRVLFQKELSESEVSAVVCLPVAPTRMSDPRPYEWTAVLIGKFGCDLACDRA